MQNWLHSQAKQWGKFEYLIVPELHKDGAIHFHAILKGYKGVIRLNGHKDRSGRPKYDFVGFRAGIAQATRIVDLTAGLEYVAKYIGKEMPDFENKKRYWASRSLKRPTVLYNSKHVYTKQKPQNLYQTSLYMAYEIPRLNQ
jgi:hypothetical protein